MSGIVEKAKNLVADKVAHVEKPTAELTWMSISHVNRKAVGLHSDVVVSNPYDHDLPICEITYKISCANREVATGSIPDPGDVKANDKTTFKVATEVAYDALLNILRDIGADWDIDYRIDVGLRVDLPIVGNLTIPLSQNGTLKLPTISDIF